MELKQFILEAGITQVRVAKDLGISLQRVNALVRRKRKPTIHMAKQVQEYTRGLVSVEDLMKGWEKPAKPDPLIEYFKRKNLL